MNTLITETQLVLTGAGDLPAGESLFTKWDLLEVNLVDMIGGIATILALVIFFVIAGQKKFSIPAIVIGIVVGAMILIMAAAGGLSAIADTIIATFQNL